MKTQLASIRLPFALMIGMLPVKVSTDSNTILSNWRGVAVNQIGADDTVLFQDSCAAGETQRFYRAAMP